MTRASAAPPRIELAPGLEIPRLVTGLWQVADLERDGRTIDPERGADALGLPEARALAFSPLAWLDEPCRRRNLEPGAAAVADPALSG
jgi:hypothetical protein